MKLSELADLFYTTLDSAPEDTWSDWSTGSQPSATLPLRRALDPSEEIGLDNGAVLVVPVGNEYSMDESLRRGTVRQLITNKQIGVFVSVPFATKESSGFDVATWAEVQKAINLREDIETYLMGQITSIIDVDATPPEELMLDKRWYLGVTIFSVERSQCV